MQAQDRYQKQQEDIAASLARLERLLEEHAAKAKADPKNWGYVGDLERVNELVFDAASFLAGDEN